ncbi:MAG: hypothetical protein ACTSQI_13750 [Candidatus Helarchaeota archaeon]
MATASVDGIVKDIVSKMGSIVGVRVYLGLADGTGKILYMDNELGEFKDFIVNFVTNNFKYLQIGEHSLPISGRNIMFFRYPKAILVLYSNKGRVGQLLSFKSLMTKYQAAIDGIVGEITLETVPIKLKIEEGPLEPDSIATIPAKTVEKAIFSRINAYYQEIFPKVTKKLKGSERFSLTTSVILNYSDGENSLLDVLDKLNISQEEALREIYKLNKANKIQFLNHELFAISCPICKSETYAFVPSIFLKRSPKEYIRLQASTVSCDHACYVIIDKKGKLKINSIKRMRDITGEIDLSDLSIEKLIAFFGQDIFFSLFHAVFFKYRVIFLESNNFAQHFCEFLKNFFPNISYGNEVQSISRADFLKFGKKYSDALIVDLISNVIVNEPYETEDLDFEFNLFRKVLKERDEQVQILKTHSEFERLILMIDAILNEIEMFKEIKEDELINIMRKKYNIDLERSEIPIIKELADIYYGVDIRKKITKTLVGKVSDFFESI